ncbi:MAG: LysR family transcriptional regulator, partial [Spirosoma sp.]|nr:LysR family transcriptional regulator [Spirosoma sp.]
DRVFKFGMTMDRLKAMNAFVRAVELGSLSAAARELNTTQPTVSKLVASLEHSVGARLLERSSTHMVPTDEGSRFVGRAKELLEDYEDAISELVASSRDPKGLVRISAPVALGVLRLNALMLQALQAFPLLEIELLLEDRFVDPVEERIDLTLRISGTLPPDLVAHPLAVWPRYFVASPDYVERKGKPRQPADMVTHDYLRYAGNDDAVVLNGPAGAVTLSVPTRYRVNSAVAMLEAVRSGAGVALQPSWMVDALLKEKKLVRLLPQWTGPSQTAHLVYAPRRRQPIRVKLMTEFLLAHVSTW